VARITFQKRQKEMKRKEKQQLKAEKRAQRKIAKTTEFDAAVQDSSAHIDQPEESVAPMHKFLEAAGIEKQIQADSRETAIERWTKNEDQGNSERKATSS
jgi:hypothetical protein